VLKHCVPAAVAGIAFLSGGQGDEQATENLAAMNRRFPGLPWPLTFSYGRALQQPALKAWKGAAANVAQAQALLAHRARMNGLAAMGQYNPELEKKAA
jgi:fructose-bisphosphate aldolase class I